MCGVLDERGRLYGEGACRSDGQPQIEQLMGKGK